MISCGPSLPQWTLSLKSLPALKERDIELWANQSRIPKAVPTKGYVNFAESYVHDAEVRTAIDGCCVRAKCFKSMKKNDPPHSLNLKLSIICSCKAGEGDCNHILGLLYLIHHYCKCGYKTVPILQSKTSLKQIWHIPARTNGITPKKVQDINFQKISLSKSVEGSPQAKRFRLDGVKSSFYNPVETPLPCFQFINLLSHNLDSVNSGAQFRAILSNTNIECMDMVNCSLGPVPKGCVLSYQQPILDSENTLDILNNHPNVTDFPPFKLRKLDSCVSFVLTHSQQDVFDGLFVSESDSLHIEKTTRDQSSNSMWHKFRCNRLTSSIFKRIVSRQGDFLKLAESLASKKSITTAAMQYGIDHEGEAASKYAGLSGNNVYGCGLVINPSCPHLGSSPDRKVYDITANPKYGLLEIKCPTSVSISDVKYLKLHGQSYKLKETHDYYYQVLGQMALTGLLWCDFYVMCKDDFHLERIYFNQNKWNQKKEKLDLFYFEHYLTYISK